MPKLYANTVYMVLNSRIRILGGRDTYMSPTDMVISTGSTMIRDTNSQSPQHSLGTDGRQGRAPVVAITKEVFNGDFDMGRMNVSHCGSCTELLIGADQFPPRTNHRTRTWDMPRNYSSFELTLCIGTHSDLFISLCCNCWPNVTVLR